MRTFQLKGDTALPPFVFEYTVYIYTVVKKMFDILKMPSDRSCTLKKK
jgi:hypothetical protein